MDSKKADPSENAVSCDGSARQSHTRYLSASLLDGLLFVALAEFEEQVFEVRDLVL